MTTLTGNSCPRCRYAFEVFDRGACPRCTPAKAAMVTPPVTMVSSYDDSSSRDEARHSLAIGLGMSALLVVSAGCAAFHYVVTVIGKF